MASPVLLDLLAVATSAALPPQLALRRAVDAADGPLAEELASSCAQPIWADDGATSSWPLLGERKVLVSDKGDELAHSNSLVHDAAQLAVLWRGNARVVKRHHLPLVVEDG